ncbi:MAG: hypothetical protein V1649_00180 [Patescibacteria group bacterium]
MENQYANELRQQRMAAAYRSGTRRVHDTDDTDKIMSDIAVDEARKRAEGNGGEGGSLRERMTRARQALDLKERAKKKLEEKVMDPAKAGISELLKQAWLNLISSFGLTLIWINIHVFLRWVLGDKLFCKLGEEWLPKQISQATGQKGEKMSGQAIGLVEVMALIFLDLLVLICLIIIVAVFMIILEYAEKIFGWLDFF